MKKPLVTLFICAALWTTSLTYANPVKKNGATRPTVNILQWWGYIVSTDPYVKKIEDECNVNISYDQYYSNDEFIQRMKIPDTSYDIVIFSETIYKAMQNKIARHNSTLYKMAQDYYPAIREEYNRMHFPSNVLFFIHSLTGFLYNPKNIHFSEKDDIFQLFSKAKNKLVVMIDDPIEAEFLLSLGLRETGSKEADLDQNIGLVPLTIDNFQKLYNGTQFIITNLPNRIINYPNFAFAFQWSGDAIANIKNNQGNLDFFVHPKLSYVTSDLIATLNNKQSSVCVARYLASKWFLNHEQNLTYYFSPYGDGSEINDPSLKKIFNDWIKHLDTLPWIISVDEKQFEKLGKQWDTIKLNIVEQSNQQ